MNIRFYKNFSKRKNSTKRPSASDNYNDRNCHLKEDTSLDNPSIVLSNREGNMSQTGNPITTSNAIASNANSCSVSFSPSQTYNGYDKPWAPGDYVNKWDEQWEVGSISSTNGSNTPAADRLRSINYISVIPGETYYFHSLITVNGLFFLRLYDSNEIYIANASVNINNTYTIPSNVAYIRFTFVATMAGTYYHDICINISDSSINGHYYPYSNICAINGKTSINLNANGNTISESFGQTVYGGVWNVITGSVRDDWDVIASYNGESLPGEWFSTMDLYSSINPPTTGAEVVYKVTTPTSFTIPGHVVSLNENVNTLSANADSITINYDISTSGDLPLNYSYAYIDKFKKYYFVGAPVILTDGTVQYDLEEDPLATHKTEIGSTVAHIAYSSTGWDKDLTDNRIAVKGTKSIYHASQALPLESVGSGCYIIGVVNGQNDGSRTGALSYYRMSASELSQLIKYMMKKDIWDSIKEYFNGKTMDFIQSCIWVPHTGAGFVGTLQTTFYVGDTAIADYSTVPATPVYIDHYPITTKVLSLGVTSVSLGSKFQDFRDNQPYSSASLYLPGVGLTDLNINDFYESDNVNIETILDITTGDITYKIYDDSNQLLKTVSFNGSASVSMSQINMNAAGAIAGIGGVVGGVVGMGLSALTMNPVAVAGAGVGVLAGASAAVMAANQRSTSIKGTNSGRSGFFTNAASTVVVRQDTEDPDDVNFIARCGRPVAATHAISNHSGYVQCEGASVNIAGDTWERDKINSYLNSGFYYE